MVKSTRERSRWTTRAYSVLQNGGVLRFRKELVEGAFGSIQEVYRFKAERVPARDPDERLKLARWCLSHRLERRGQGAAAGRARAEPRQPRDQEHDRQYRQRPRRARPCATRRWCGRGRARGRRASRRARPQHLSVPAAVRPGVPPPGLPMIFDLPTPLAVKRADEFTRSVHPVLQHACARCHNENHQGDFQLIQVKSRHDWTPNVARANLEAALRVVDPDSPARSELLDPLAGPPRAVQATDLPGRDRSRLSAGGGLGEQPPPQFGRRVVRAGAVRPARSRPPPPRRPMPPVSRPIERVRPLRPPPIAANPAARRAASASRDTQPGDPPASRVSTSRGAGRGCSPTPRPMPTSPSPT